MMLRHCDKEHNGSWDVCFCFPKDISSHAGKRGGIWLVQRDLDRAVRV